MAKPEQEYWLLAEESSTRRFSCLSALPEVSKECGLKRWNQLDVSIKKNIKIGKTLVAPSLDFFNVLNSNVVLAQIQAFGSSLGQPTNILQPRLLRISAQIKF